jgi:hypothetical protein
VLEHAGAAAHHKEETMGKVRIPKKPMNVTQIPERENSPISRAKGPALSLDDIMIATTDTNGHGLTLSGDDLARVLNFIKAHGGVLAATDDGDVNLQLRGLAELFGSRTGGDCHGHVELGEAGAFFLARTLEELAARLETDAHRGDWFAALLEKKKAEVA